MLLLLLGSCWLRHGYIVRATGAYHARHNGLASASTGSTAL